MASDSQKSFLQIFTWSFYECYLGEEREVALEKSPLIWGALGRGGLQSTGHWPLHRWPEMASARPSQCWKPSL